MQDAADEGVRDWRPARIAEKDSRRQEGGDRANLDGPFDFSPTQTRTRCGGRERTGRSRVLPRQQEKAEA
jgi:hypothetical protein